VHHHLGLPEMIIIFIIAILIFGPLALPYLRQVVDDRGYPLSWIIVFGLFLAVALAYGLVNTVPLFQ